MEGCVGRVTSRAKVFMSLNSRPVAFMNRPFDVGGFAAGCWSWDFFSALSTECARMFEEEASNGFCRPFIFIGRIGVVPCLSWMGISGLLR